jgi:hypothetical protein
MPAVTDRVPPLPFIEREAFAGRAQASKLSRSWARIMVSSARAWSSMVGGFGFGG